MWESYLELQLGCQAQMASTKHLKFRYPFHTWVTQSDQFVFSSEPLAFGYRLVYESVPFKSFHFRILTAIFEIFDLGQGPRASFGPWGPTVLSSSFSSMTFGVWGTGLVFSSFGLWGLGVIPFSFIWALGSCALFHFRSGPRVLPFSSFGF